MSSGEGLITFGITLDGVYVDTYEAIQGMTWEDWLASEYNTGGYAINTRFGIISLVIGRLEIGVRYRMGGEFVAPSDIIIDKYEYVHN